MSYLFSVFCTVLILGIGHCQTVFEIVHITEYMRHGARTTWTNNLNLSFTKDLGIGNITANGMRMHFVLGSQIRKNYPTIFGSAFNNTDVEVKSSSIYRCIESAQAHLLGMYPLGTGEAYTLSTSDSKGLPAFDGITETFVNASALPRAFRPFPYSVSSLQIDDHFFPSMFETCPIANKYSSELTKNKIATYGSLITQLDKDLKAIGLDPKNIFNTTNYNINSVALLYDEMKSYLNYFGQYYQGVTSDIFTRMYRIANLNFKLLFPDEKMERLLSDGVARDIVEGLQGVVSGTSQLKFRLFSGHDTGLFTHMLRYNLSDEQCLHDLVVNGTSSRPCRDIPDFASSFIYELAKKNDEYYVRILYNGEALKICDLNEGDLYCKFDNFKAMVVDKLYYNDGDKTGFCGNPLANTFKNNTSSHNDLKIAIGVAVSILVIALLAIIWLMFATSRLNKHVTAYHPVVDEISNSPDSKKRGV